MPADGRFPKVVSLACHDLRTPLATVYGFARTLTRAGDLDERSARFIAMIEEASQQLTDLLDLLGTAARIEAGSWEPALREADTLELATSADERIAANGQGAPIDTDAGSVARALAALAICAVRHGPADAVTWHVSGRTLELSPVTADAAPVITGEVLRDLGSVIACRVLEELGGSLTLDGDTLRVTL